MSGATLHLLSIQRFRALEACIWRPSGRLNVILDGGDVGKTTILEAIVLLFSPTNTTVVSDTDYYARDVDAGFEIEAVCELPSGSGINQQVKASWPWEWNGTEAVVPMERHDGAAPGK